MKKSSDIKRIDIKEFREKGYLQELNRRFLHPLGLALAVNIDEEGNETLEGVWDYREDLEGIYFDIQNRGEVVRKQCLEKYLTISAEEDKRRAAREKELGFFVEPINPAPKKEDPNE
jgi:hypothetical protein